MKPGAILRAAILACAWLPLCASAVEIYVSGAVADPGVRQLPPKAKLADAALAVGVRLDGYPLGAAWLRPSLQQEQTRQKAGLLYDLDTVRQQAARDDHQDVAEVAASLREWLQALPVTGRQVALLDPRAVEITPAENRLVGDGDTLFYPTRPDGIRIVGAVTHPCNLPLVALQAARDYAKACPSLSAADRDWIFVIQPDGHVFRQGIGLWNPGQPMPLAPGAVVYVPLRESSVRTAAPDLNRELADFLATQPLAGPETQR